MSDQQNLVRRVKHLWKTRHTHDGDTTSEELTVIRTLVEEQADSVATRTGAYAHLSAPTAQTIDAGGEAISWTSLGILGYQNVDAPTLPATSVDLQLAGYYNIAVQLGWTSFEGGGTVTVVRTRGGVDAVVWPPTGDPGLWTTMSARLFEGTAEAIPCQVGDSLSVEVDHGEASGQSLASATLAVYLVDAIAAASAAASYGYADLVMSHEPIAYYRLDETASPAADYTGNGHDGTYHTTPVVAEGLIDEPNPAVDFERVNSQEMYTNSNVDDFNVSAITVEAWIQTDVKDDYMMIVARDDHDINTNHRQFQFRIEETTGYLQFVVLDPADGPTSTITGTTDLTDGIRHHVAVTYDGTDAVLYVDGQVHQTSTLSDALQAPSGGPYLRVGAREGVSIPSGEGNDYFEGVIDEVAVYGRVLTALELGSHWQVGTQG